MSPFQIIFFDKSQNFFIIFLSIYFIINALILYLWLLQVRALKIETAASKLQGLFISLFISLNNPDLCIQTASPCTNYITLLLSPLTTLPQLSKHEFYTPAEEYTKLELIFLLKIVFGLYCLHGIEMLNSISVSIIPEAVVC